MSALNFTDKDSINRYIDGVKNKTAITTPITWSAANKHLIDEFMNIIERSFEVSDDDAGILDKNAIKKLFQLQPGTTKKFSQLQLASISHPTATTSDNKQIEVKFFSMDLVLSTYLANIESLTSYSIKTAVKEFAFETSAALLDKRSELYTFLMNLLKIYPPINWKTRLFWMKIITQYKTESADDVIWKDVVQIFARKSYAIFKEALKPLEFRWFLLTFFEYDYAAIHCKLYASDSQHNHRRVTHLSRPKDLEEIPLAFLMLCEVKPASAFGNESRDKKTIPAHTITDVSSNKHRYRDLALRFEIVSEEQTFALQSQLYAKLIALLLDCQLYMKGIDNFPNIYSIDEIPELVRDYVRQFKATIKGANLINLIDVLWVRNLLLLKEI